jgi:hypothetical protein
MATTQHLAPTLHAAVAEEMRLMAALMEQLAETLVGDEEIAARYLDQFQTFDLVIQCAAESAAVLDRLAQGACPHDAIAPVRLTAVQDRLRGALGVAA